MNILSTSNMATPRATIVFAFCAFLVIFQFTINAFVAVDAFTPPQINVKNNVSYLKPMSINTPQSCLTSGSASNPTISSTTSADKYYNSRLYVEPPLTKPPAFKNGDKKQGQEQQEENDSLSQTFGGYTVKQRLREEVESPFRKVRLLFFASSAGSALTALYFSSLGALKAYIGGYSDAPPLEEALTSCAINIGGAVVCGLLAYRDYQAGQANLERIARGGKLARLAVSPAAASTSMVKTLSKYRRNSRVLICAGGKEYVETICKSLNADQRGDENVFPQLLEDVNVLVVPVYLTDSFSVGDTKQIWKNTIPSESDRNFDSTRSDGAVAFPWNNASWKDYLQTEIDTANNQGFDVLGKGITILVKKNGKILRRATGYPRWDELIGTMEVMDGSRFGMPGDSERYGGP